MEPLAGVRESRELRVRGAGARGVSILAASGDSGVGGDGTDDGNCTNGRFLPTFPASSPWVTAVGGALLPRRGDGRAYTLQDEVALGQLRRRLQRPLPRAGLPERLGARLPQGRPPAARGPLQLDGAARGYPDVATQSLKFVVTANGLGYSGVSGTSPRRRRSRARVLLSSRRLAAGKEPRLGFLNPLLYANPDGLNDIIIGSNPACGAMGFQSRDDWDPVTGLGTPIFAALSDIVDALP